VDIVEVQDCESKPYLPCNGRQGIIYALCSAVCIVSYFLSYMKWYQDHRSSIRFHSVFLVILAVCVPLCIFFRSVLHSFPFFSKDALFFLLFFFTWQTFHQHFPIFFCVTSGIYTPGPHATLCLVALWLYLPASLDSCDDRAGHFSPFYSGRVSRRNGQ